MYCSSGKIMFKARSTAKKIRKQIGSKHGGKKFSVYMCPECQTWHLATKRVKA
jgi:hypothetical protein